jgi:hypothetical protein
VLQAMVKLSVHFAPIDPWIDLPPSSRLYSAGRASLLCPMLPPLNIWLGSATWLAQTMLQSYKGEPQSRFLDLLSLSTLLSPSFLVFLLMDQACTSCDAGDKENVPPSPSRPSEGWLKTPSWIGEFMAWFTVSFSADASHGPNAHWHPMFRQWCEPPSFLHFS